MLWEVERVLQEIKTQEENFPKDAFKQAGYESYVFGQKSYNGVAFLSKYKISNIDKNFIKDKLKQSRVITGDIKIKSKKIKLINIYVPNGNPIDTKKYDYKKDWLVSFNKNIKRIQKEYSNRSAIISSRLFHN